MKNVMIDTMMVFLHAFASAAATAAAAAFAAAVVAADPPGYSTGSFSGLSSSCVCVVCLMTVVAAAGLGTYYCDGKRRFTTDENLPDVFH